MPRVLDEFFYQGSVTKVLSVTLGRRGIPADVKLLFQTKWKFLICNTDNLDILFRRPISKTIRYIYLADQNKGRSIF